MLVVSDPGFSSLQPVVLLLLLFVSVPSLGMATVVVRRRSKMMTLWSTSAVVLV